jgi:hypothetical protein
MGTGIDFHFEMSPEDTPQIETLNTKESCFFFHHNPEIVKWHCGVE